MRLSDFILHNLDAILDEWTVFAATLVPARHKMNHAMLLDHARRMLEVIAEDLTIPETAAEQADKSKGHDLRGRAMLSERTAATLHGAARQESGFSLDATLSEYRALRASVTRLWEEAHQDGVMSPEEVVDLIRFNEAIDQALTESVASYYFEKEQKTRVFDALLSSTPDLSFTFNLKGNFTFANKSFLELLGIPLNVLLDKNFEDLKVSNAAELNRQVQFVIQARQPVRGEVHFAPPFGREDLYEYIFAPVFDEDGAIEGVAGTSRNITDRKAAELRNWKQANFDPLTGLPNRCLFRDRLEQEVRHAVRIQAPIALLFIDLDKFKDVNDHYGHDAGDLLLQYAAARMRTCVRETDTVARLGGDEFMIILQDLSETGHAENVARKILEQMEKPFHIKQQEFRISASIGIAIAPDDADTPETLIKDADTAMYAAKAAGSNRYNFYARMG